MQAECKPKQIIFILPFLLLFFCGLHDYTYSALCFFFFSLHFVKHVKDISPKSYIFWQIYKIFRQNCISLANFVIKIKHISTEFVKDLLLKCAYFT
jgi:hypothetical protein